MTQREVGDYLGISEAAVKKRLHNARRRLGGYVIDMAKTISDEATPDDISVCAGNRGVGQPSSTPVDPGPPRSHKVVDRIKAALPEFESIDSRRRSRRQTSIRRFARRTLRSPTDAYRLDDRTVLRTQTTWASLRAIKRTNDSCPVDDGWSRVQALRRRR